MSSVTTDVAVAVAVAADEVTVAAVEKAPRRFPPPCWTQEEALTLIDAYRERWYALRRGYLRTADWDAVAAAVESRYPGASPAKTSAQCRHKIEKLRQRYRAEKQRALTLPCPAGRYLSSWFFFDNMEAMENGTTPQRSENSPDGSRLNPSNTLKLKRNPESSPDLNIVLQAKRLNSANKLPIQYPEYLDMEIADKDEDDLQKPGMRNRPTNRIPIAIQPKSKKPGKLFNYQMLPPAPVTGSRNENFGSDYNSKSELGTRSRYWASSNSKPSRWKSGVEEIVASIKLMGEGFVKMEKEKMEMSREMEGMRMEMEMKRNRMVLESQKQIVDTFLKGLVELGERKSEKVKSGDGVEENSGES